MESKIEFFNRLAKCADIKPDDLLRQSEYYLKGYLKIRHEAARLLHSGVDDMYKDQIYEYFNHAEDMVKKLLGLGDPLFVNGRTETVIRSDLYNADSNLFYLIRKIEEFDE